MGILLSKCHCYTTRLQLKKRIQVLEQQLHELNALREREALEYDEWRKERRRVREEMARLKKRVSEDEERIQSLEEELMAVRDAECTEWRHWMGTECLVEHMKEEQKQREVAVEKWKNLYLTIKNELDHLILTTKSQGGRYGFGAEEGLIERLRAEVMAKEATMEALRSRLLTMEKAGVKRDREIDILKQSLRILSNAKKSGIRRRLQRRWLL